MATPVKYLKERRQKSGEASSEERDLLSFSSGERHGIQVDFLPCLTCMLKTQSDSSYSHKEEYCKVTPQPFSMLPLKLTDSSFPHILSTRACKVLMLDTWVHILKQGNDARTVAYPHVNFRCGFCEQHRMVAFVGVGPFEPALSHIGEEGGRMNFKILLAVTEERGNFFTFGSFHHFARASRPGFKKHMSFGGLALCRQADGAIFTNFHLFWYFNGPAAIIKPPLLILDSSLIPAEASLVRVTNDRKREVDWSSLPVLPLLMIRDRLNVFDNRRLAAVCRDWRSTSARYPKNLYSFGDGEPWICHLKYGMESQTWEFISVSKNRKFQVDMPEFAFSEVLFSKGGWMLLLNSYFYRREHCSWFLVNPFTRDTIELPKRQGWCSTCHGLFKLNNNGYPDRVYLIIPEVPSFQACIINTARPGDKEWTSHHYTGLQRELRRFFSPFAIGDMVYCKDSDSYITVFNLANNSVKVLPPSRGLITEHEGELIHVFRKVDSRKRLKSIVVLKYHDASSSWKKLKHNPVMDTSWYQCEERGTISAKGSGGGMKVYMLLYKVEATRPEYTYQSVGVRDLLTGKTRSARVPFPHHNYLFWVAIG